MKKSSMAIATAIVVIVGGGAIVFAHYKKAPVAVVQPVAVMPTVQDSTTQPPSVVATTATVQPTTSVPIAEKTAKPKTVTVQSTASVVVPPVVQPTPQPVAPAPSPVVTPAPEPTSMYNVLTLSSSTDHKKSAVFTMKGTTWRIDYSCGFTDNTDPYSIFNAYLKSADGSVSNNFADLVTDCPTDYSDDGHHSVTLKNQIPGDYYLDIGINDNITYSVTVWDIH